MNSLIMVDSGDEDVLDQHRWYVVATSRNKLYVTTTVRTSGGKNKTVYLHRHLMKPTKFEEVDHINGNGLDNRRQNLRIASRAENCWNTIREVSRSGFRGVYKNSTSDRWQARIRDHGTPRYLGSFDSEVDAAHAYDKAARSAHGVFARLNFPSGTEQPSRVNQ